MNHPCPLSRTTATWPSLGVLLLLSLCFALEAPPAPAADATPTATVLQAPTAPGAVGHTPPLSWWDNVLGNQTRMIQVGLIVIVIGIFLLSRSVR